MSASAGSDMCELLVAPCTLPPCMHARLHPPHTSACDDQLQARASLRPLGRPPAVILSLVRLSEATCRCMQVTLHSTS